MLERLTLTLFQVEYKMLKPMECPGFAAPMLRGAIGRHLPPDAQAVCYGHGHTPAPTDQRPFFVCPPEDKRPVSGACGRTVLRWRQGEILAFHIGLIGSAARFHAHLPPAIERAGEVGLGSNNVPASLVRADLIPHYASCPPPHIPWPITLTHDDVVTRANRFQGRKLRLEFLTPVCMQRQIFGTKKSVLLHPPSAADLAKSLVTRLSAFSEGFGAGTPPPNSIPPKCIADELMAACRDQVPLRVETWQETHYRVSGGKPKPITGIRGNITFPPFPPALLPWLVWGESLHIGNDTVHGMGIYEIHLA